MMNTANRQLIKLPGLPEPGAGQGGSEIHRRVWSPHEVQSAAVCVALGSAFRASDSELTGRPSSSPFLFIL